MTDLISLFKEYRTINTKREEAYAKVYAEMNVQRRDAKLKEAKSMDNKLSDIMHKINEQAKRECIPTKRMRYK